MQEKETRKKSRKPFGGRRSERGEERGTERRFKSERGEERGTERRSKGERSEERRTRGERPFKRTSDRGERFEEHGGRKEHRDNMIEGRNAVIEAYRSGRTIDRLYLLEGTLEGAMQTVQREARKHNTPVKFVTRARLDQMSETGRHQGVIAITAAYHYAELDDVLSKVEANGEEPFFILLDNIEDPHNLGAIIRTANIAGAHGVIIPKDRAVGLTATVAKASAGAINFTPVIRVTNMVRTIEELKKHNIWITCADMDGTPMTQLNMTGPIGLVIGAEGSGISKLVRENCDMVASIPRKGQIESLNASVAAGVLAYEILRQREQTIEKI